MLVQYHTPKGIITIDTETVTDEELEVLHISRDKLPKPQVFEASPPGLALGERLNNIEDFMERLYPG